MNQSGALEVRCERIGRDTSFGRIIDAAEHAECRPAPIQKTADRLAGYLVYFAMLAAAVTFTLLAILGAIGRAARAGAIIKGGTRPCLRALVQNVTPACT